MLHACTFFFSSCEKDFRFELKIETDQRYGFFSMKNK